MRDTLDPLLFSFGYRIRMQRNNLRHISAPRQRIGQVPGHLHANVQRMPLVTIEVMSAIMADTSRHASTSCSSAR